MAKSKRTKESEEEPVDSSSLTQKFTAALSKTIDFSRTERLLSEAISRFKEQSYRTAIQTSRDSVLRIEDKVEDYLEVSWAVAILSMSHMLENANKASKLASEGQRRLQDAIDAFMTGNFADSPEILERLSDAAQNLYAFEMDMAREHVAAQSRALKEVQAMGGDIGAASTVLSRAAEALAEDDWTGYLDLIEKADDLVERAKEARVAEIKQSASIMASKFLDDVRQAIQSGDFVAANYLVNVAEQQATPGTQVPTTERVSLMKDRMVRKVRKFIAQIGPILEKAEDRGFDSAQARDDLESAQQLLQTGDYVNALMMAKKAYGAVKKHRGEAPGVAGENDLPEGPSPAEPEEVEVPEDAEEPEVPEEPEETPDEELSRAEKRAKKREAKRAAKEAAKEEAPEETGEEGEAFEGANLDDLIEEPVLWCTRCGSVNIGVGDEGKAKCLDCGEKLSLVGRPGS